MVVSLIGNSGGPFPTKRYITFPQKGLLTVATVRSNRRHNESSFRASCRRVLTSLSSTPSRSSHKKIYYFPHFPQKGLLTVATVRSNRRHNESSFRASCRGVLTSLSSTPSRSPHKIGPFCGKWTKMWENVSREGFHYASPASGGGSAVRSSFFGWQPQIRSLFGPHVAQFSFQTSLLVFENSPLNIVLNTSGLLQTSPAPL